ncbi:MULTISPECIES: SDR family NAD(P)-dependent oxidoreductase [unclassified Peribacillus]|uniref:SDR family NAD(P)-dependent oxidoreductase n=1 Tax=unclassified Peribacillus TaxID=2675266 RepID=UPI001F4E9794|nr:MULTISPECIES: SDR family NAD(P)-dependent oxidoreductase [unclassified Peribacillus]MCK1985990.1 SDR family oxidoreductase [Peribacillus sp. Aquil_B1]MCK2011213.1 SDR family oxidoreductase [Peribacillus sp. Aquil_B8]
MIDISGIRIVITGATDGLGLYLTKEFINTHDAKIVAIGKRDISETPLYCIKDKIEYIKYDLRDPNNISDLVDRTINVYNGVDLLINNACHLESEGTLSINYNHLLDHFNVNTFSPLLFTSQIIQEMKKDDFGRIIMINTESSLQVREGLASYSSSKVALLSLNRAIAQALRGHNITSNSILFSSLATPYYLNEYQKAADNLNVDVREFTSNFLQKNFPYSTYDSLIPLETVLDTIMFIYSSNNSLNGLNWKIDGGALSTII